MTGRVVSVKMKDSAVVVVERTAIHTMYKKRFLRSKKYIVVNGIDSKLGDIVELSQIRPISKNKTWKIAKVVGRDIEAIVSEHLQESAAKEIAEVMPEPEPETKEEGKDVTA